MDNTHIDIKYQRIFALNPPTEEYFKKILKIAIRFQNDLNRFIKEEYYMFNHVLTEWESYQLNIEKQIIKDFWILVESVSWYLYNENRLHYMYLI